MSMDRISTKIKHCRHYYKCWDDAFTCPKCFSCKQYHPCGLCLKTKKYFSAPNEKEESTEDFRNGMLKQRTVNVCLHVSSNWDDNFTCKQCSECERYHPCGECSIWDSCNYINEHKSKYKRKELGSSTCDNNMSKPYSCVFCGEPFSRKVLCLFHEKACKKRPDFKEKKFKCSVCWQQFSERLILLKHERTCEPEKPFVCKGCGQKFTYQSTYSFHVKNNCKISRKCKLCKKTFPTVNLRFRHEITCKEHLNSKRRNSLTKLKNRKMICELCGKCFKSNHRLKLHLDSDHKLSPEEMDTKIQSKVNIMVWSCNKCDESFSTFGQLDTHVTTKHKQNYYICSVCDDIFENFGNLKQHCDIHNGFVETSEDKIQELEKKSVVNNCYECKCGMLFREFDDFKAHVLKHTYEKNLKGNQLTETNDTSKSGSIYKKTQLETIYQLQQTESTNETTESGPVDSTTKNRFSHYTIINQSVYPKTLNDAVSKQYNCLDCNLQFSDIKKFICHINTHRNMRKQIQGINIEANDGESLEYTCSVCLKKFVYFEQFKEHMIRQCKAIEDHNLSNFVHSRKFPSSKKKYFLADFQMYRRKQKPHTITDFNKETHNTQRTKSGSGRVTSYSTQKIHTELDLTEEVLPVRNLSVCSMQEEQDINCEEHVSDDITHLTDQYDKVITESNENESEQNDSNIKILEGSVCSLSETFGNELNEVSTDNNNKASALSPDVCNVLNEETCDEREIMHDIYSESQQFQSEVTKNKLVNGNRAANIEEMKMRFSRIMSRLSEHVRSFSKDSNTSTSKDKNPPCNNTREPDSQTATTNVTYRCSICYKMMDFSNISEHVANTGHGQFSTGNGAPSHGQSSTNAFVSTDRCVEQTLMNLPVLPELNQPIQTLVVCDENIPNISPSNTNRISEQQEIVYMSPLRNSKVKARQLDINSKKNQNIAEPPCDRQTQSLNTVTENHTQSRCSKCWKILSGPVSFSTHNSLCHVKGDNSISNSIQIQDTSQTRCNITKAPFSTSFQNTSTSFVNECPEKDRFNYMVTDQAATSYNKTVNNASHGSNVDYFCNVCSIEFQNQYDFLIHMNSCTDNERIVSLSSSKNICRLCHRSFNNRLHLIKHLEMHSKSNPYLCSLCGLQFITALELKGHMKQEHDVEDEMSNGQNKCEITFHKEELFTEHVNPYLCSICGLQFITAFELKGHMKQEHDIEDDMSSGLYCHKCEITFHREEHFHEHVKICRKQYRCKKCSTVCESLYHYVNHWKTCKTKVRLSQKNAVITISDSDNDNCSELTEKQDNERMYDQKSDSVDYELNQWSDNSQDGNETDEYQEHNGADNEFKSDKKDSGSSVDDNECSLCGRKFRKKIYLMEHMRDCRIIESPIKPAVRTSIYAQRHLRITDGDSYGTTCSKCGRKFKGTFELKRHQIQCPVRYKTVKRLPVCEVVIERLNICGICSQQFHTESALKMHENAHRNTEKASCQRNKLRLRNLNEKKTEETSKSIEHGNIKSPFQERKLKNCVCQFCSRVFQTVFNLKRHENVCKSKSDTVSTTCKKLRYGCNSCNLKFHNVGDHIRHKTVCSENRKFGKNYYCQICFSAFSSQPAQIMHTKVCKKKMNSGQRQFKCPKCKNIFWKRNSLLLHIKSCKVRINGVQCSRCKKLFPGTFHLSCHAKYCNRQIQTIETATCSICQRDFKDLNNLKRHKIVCKAKSKENKAFKCSKCKIGFTRQYNLRVHQVKCLLRCDDCRKSFSSRSNLFRHRKICKSANVSMDKVDTRNIIYRCSFCGKEFPVMKNLIAHKKVCKQVNTSNNIEKNKIDIKSDSTDDGKSLVCKICRYQFFTLNSLENHEILCLQKHSLKCSICLKQFWNNKEYSFHEKICKKRFENSEDSYICDLCNCRFISRSVLLSHQKHCRDKQSRDTLNLSSEKNGKTNKSKDFVFSFKCVSCSKVFKNPKDLCSHKRTCMKNHRNVNRANNTKIKDYNKSKCSVGKITYKRPIEINNHTTSGIKPDRKDIEIKCKICKKRFERPVGLIKHRKVGCNVISTGKGEFSWNCSGCQKKLPTRNSLRNHRMKCVKVTSFFKCRLCGKKFTPVHHHNHERICKEIENFKRDGNSKTLNVNLFRCDNFVDLMKKYMKNSFRLFKFDKFLRPPFKELGQYICGVCNETFIEHDLLNQHAKLHTGRTKLKTNTFACTICAKSFGSFSCLSKHLNCHYTGINNYLCKICRIDFKSYRLFTKHMNKHIIRLYWNGCHNVVRSKNPSIIGGRIVITESRTEEKTMTKYVSDLEARNDLSDLKCSADVVAKEMSEQVVLVKNTDIMEDESGFDQYTVKVTASNGNTTVEELKLITMDNAKIKEEIQISDVDPRLDERHKITDITGTTGAKYCGLGILEKSHFEKGVIIQDGKGTKCNKIELHESTNREKHDESKVKLNNLKGDKIREMQSEDEISKDLKTIVSHLHDDIDMLEGHEDTCRQTGKGVVNLDNSNGGNVRSFDDFQAGHVLETLDHSGKLKRKSRDNDVDKTCSLNKKTIRNERSISFHRIQKNNFSRGRLLRNKCVICGRSFKHVELLYGHLQIHQKGRDCICNICNASFCRSYHLRQHIKRNHNQVLRIKDLKIHLRQCDDNRLINKFQGFAVVS